MPGPPLCPRTSTPFIHSTSQPHLEVHTPIIPILLTRKLRCSALLKATHSSLQQICPASPPLAVSRMSLLEGVRLIEQEGASQGLRAAGQSSRTVARRSCLLAGLAAQQTRKRGGPGRRPRLHLQSLILMLPHPQGPPRGIASCHFHGMFSSPGHTGSTWPPHSCPFLTPTCFLTQTAPCLGSCNSFTHSFIQQTSIEWFYALGIHLRINSDPCSMSGYSGVGKSQ